MSEQASRSDSPTGSSRPQFELGTSRDNATHPLRMLGLAVACLVVAAIAAATFVLSYSGIHAVAIQAGVSPQHARDYPLLIDAMLVIALAAVLALRGAGLPSRVFAWLILLAVLAAAAGADALHATGHILRHTVGAVTAAVLPWALVLIAFLLLFALLRHATLRRHASARHPAAPGTEAAPDEAGWPSVRTAPPLPVRTPQPWNSASIVPGFSRQLASSAAAGAAAAGSEQPSPVPEADQVDRDEYPDHTDSGLAAADGNAAEVSPAPREPEQAGGQTADTSGHVDVRTEPAGDGIPADPSGVETFPVAEEGDEAGAGEAATADQTAEDTADNMPVFHRMWSTPTPPDN